MVSKKEGELGEDSKLKLVGCLIVLDILYQFLSVFFADFKETFCRITLNERLFVQLISCWSFFRIPIETFPDKIFAIIRDQIPYIGGERNFGVKNIFLNLILRFIIEWRHAINNIVS